MMVRRLLVRQARRQAVQAAIVGAVTVGVVTAVLAGRFGVALAMLSVVVLTAYMSIIHTLRRLERSLGGIRRNVGAMSRNSTPDSEIDKERLQFQLRRILSAVEGERYESARRQHDLLDLIEARQKLH